jgi:hypothetical protein
LIGSDMIEKLFNIIFITVAVFFMESNASYADSFFVKIKQKGKAQEYSERCKDSSECLIPFSIVSEKGKKIEILSHVKIMPGNITFQFQTKEGYLFIGNSMGASENSSFVVLDQSGYAQSLFTLFGPPVWSSSSYMSNKSVLRTTHKAITEIELSVEPSQE